jgi:hypothetical protein
LCLLHYQQKSANGLGQVAFRRCPVRISAGDISFPNSFVWFSSLPQGNTEILH